MLIMLLFHVILSNNYDNWTSFSKVILSGDAYANYCPTEKRNGPPFPTGRCGKQRLYVSKLLPIIRSTNFIFSPIAGLSLDKFGPLITVSFGIMFAILCWVTFGFLIKTNWCVVMGCIFLGMSIDPSNFPPLMIKHRFPNSKNIVFALIGASASLGSTVPIIMNKVLENTSITFKGLSFIYAFAFLGINWAFVSIIFFKLMKENDGICLDQDCNTDIDLSNASICDCLKSLKFACISIFFFVVNLTLTYHQYFINATYKSDSYTIQILEISFVSSFIPCIILGVLVEKFGIAIVLLLLNFFGLLVPILSLYPNNVTGIIMSLCIMLMYSMFTTPIFCYVQQAFPKHVFGVISGIIYTIGGCAAMACLPLFELCESDSTRYTINIVMIIIRAVSFVPLWYIYKAGSLKQLSDV